MVHLVVVQQVVASQEVVQKVVAKQVVVHLVVVQQVVAHQILPNQAVSSENQKALADQQISGEQSTRPDRPPQA